MNEGQTQQMLTDSRMCCFFTERNKTVLQMERTSKMEKIEYRVQQNYFFSKISGVQNQFCWPNLYVKTVKEIKIKENVYI